MVAAQHRHSPNLTVVKTADEIRKDDAEVSALLALFDFALEHHKVLVAMADRVPGFKCIGGEVSLFAEHQPLAEYALQLWCSVHKDVQFSERRYERDGYCMHVIYATLNGRELVSWQKATPIAVSCDGDHRWRPTDGAA